VFVKKGTGSGFNEREVLFGSGCGGGAYKRGGEEGSDD